jgi:hypothetical protein
MHAVAVPDASAELQRSLELTGMFRLKNKTSLQHRVADQDIQLLSR